MNLQRLRYFRAAAQFQSLRRAAEALDLSQPTLSRQIQILEHELRAQLFLRASKRILLTEAGEVLLARADRILEEVEETVAEVRQAGEERRSQVTVGAIQSTLETLMPQAITSLRQRFPAVRVVLRGTQSGEIVERVARRRLDIGIIAVPVSDPRVSVRLLGREAYRLLVPAHHRLAGGECATLADALAEPLVTFPTGFVIRSTIDRIAARLGCVPRVVVEMESIAGIKQFVQRGAGLSLLPESALLNDAATPSLRVLRIASEAPVRDIVAVHLATQEPSAPAAYLCEAIRGLLAAGGATAAH